MATAIKVPDIGTTVDHVKLVKWLKKEGDTVKRGEALCEVETDKAVSELESIAEGTVLRIVAAEDTEVEQDTIIAYVGQAGEQISEESSGFRGQGSGGGNEHEASATEPRTLNPSVPPMIVNLARKLSVDLASVKGTGPGGRITKEDVMKAQGQPAAAALAGKPLSQNQLVVARRVSRSQRDIPPIDITARFDMSAVIAARKRIREESGVKISFDAFLVMAVTKVMKDFPHFRSRLEEERAVESESVNVGIAIGVGEQLFTPVIPGADGLSLKDTDAAIQRLQQKSEKGAFEPVDLKGATLTVSNLGMYPVLAFSAIIPPDQVAILTVGTTEETPVVRSGEVKVLPMATVTLSVDHRLINGREGAEFLTALKKRVEEP